MPEIPTTQDLQKALEGVDWELSRRRMLWSLNSPRCLCEPCYQSWLEWGKIVYVGQEDGYQKRVNEENLHRENVRSGRELRAKEIDSLMA
jgi:hypothetical protein